MHQPEYVPEFVGRNALNVKSARECLRTEPERAGWVVHEEGIENDVRIDDVGFPWIFAENDRFGCHREHAICEQKLIVRKRHEVQPVGAGRQSTRGFAAKGMRQVGRLHSGPRCDRILDGENLTSVLDVGMSTRVDVEREIACWKYL